MGEKFIFEVLGSNCIDCEMVLAAKINTYAVPVCTEIQSALEKGSALIKIKGNRIHFFNGGCVCSFKAEPRRLHAVERMITNGKVQMESWTDSKRHGEYAGFILRVS